MNTGPKKDAHIRETAPPPKGRTLTEGEDFSAINRLLAQMRAASSAAASQATPKPAPGADAKGKQP